MTTENDLGRPLLSQQRSALLGRMIGKDHAEGGVAPRFPMQLDSAADLIEQLLYDRYSQSHILSLALGRHPEEIFEDVGEEAGSGSVAGEGDHHALLFRKIS